MPKRGRPKCPDWLSEEAKRSWRRLVPELDRLGLLTIVDGNALAGYCQAWAEFRIATETLEREGRTIMSGGGQTVFANGKTVIRLGQVITHPAVAQQRSALAHLRAFEALFGLDPSSRTRLVTPDQGGDVDEFEAFARGANHG